jgi:hypothetical protein
MYEPTAYMSHPKVKMARKLLFEAERELRAEDNERIANELCECGHKRKVHAPSHSINYTGGACHKCDCLNFLNE